MPVFLFVVYRFCLMQHSCGAVRGNMRVRKRKRYQFFIVLLLLGILLILFAAVLFLRLRGSVALKPSKLELPAQSITAYRQDEAAWADDLLGESSYTMASSGCLVTCIASAVSMETGTAITPGSLNAIFQRIMYMTVREHSVGGVGGAGRIYSRCGARGIAASA